MSCFVRLAISPVFFILGILSYGAEKSVGSHMSHLSHMEGTDHTMDHGAMAMGVDIFGMSVTQGTAAVITSMWLMYMLMGVAHVAPWLDLMTGKRR